MDFVAAYIRLGKNNSFAEQILQVQTELLYTFAHKNRCEIFRLFTDIGYPASCQYRPGLDSMVKLMETEGIQVALTPSVSHIFRGRPFLPLTALPPYLYSVKERLLLPLLRNLL